MQGIAAFLSNPLVWKIVVSYWVFSAAVDSLPEVKATSPGVYVFTCRFLHSLAGNVKRAAATFNLPGN